MEKYIKELLFEHDCVVVPGFGGFLTQYVSADIHPITHKFIPPSKKIAFNEQLQTNDGLLVNAISIGENISREEAMKLVNESISNIRAHIQRSIFELKDVGRLFYNSDNRLEFEPETSINYFEESYGLSEMFFKPIERNFSTMNTPSNAVRPAAKRPASNKDTEAPKGGKGGLIAFLVILLVLGGATTFLYFNQDNQTLASVNPFVIFNSKEAKPVETPKPAPAVTTPAAETETQVLEEQPAREEIITAKTGRYFVIVGSFKSKDNAMKMKEQFENQNQTVTIIEPYSKKKYYRVSVADFDTKENAKSKLAGLKESYGKSLWILTY